MDQSFTNSQRWPLHVKSPGSRGSCLLQVSSQSFGLRHIATGLLPLILPTAQDSAQTGRARSQSACPLSPPSGHLFSGRELRYTQVPYSQRLRQGLPTFLYTNRFSVWGGAKACFPKVYNCPSPMSAAIVLDALCSPPPELREPLLASPDFLIQTVPKRTLFLLLASSLTQETAVPSMHSYS